MFCKTAFNPSAAFLPVVYLLVAWSVNYLLGFMSFEYAKQSLLAGDAGIAAILLILTALLWWGKRVSISCAIKALSYAATHGRKHNTIKFAKNSNILLIQILKNLS